MSSKHMSFEKTCDRHLLGGSDIHARHKRRLLVFALCLSLACVSDACHDSRFDSYYSSLDEAIKDHAVDRQWLPGFLPNSSRAIHVVGDLSPSREWCSFEFLPADSAQLKKSLKPVDAPPDSLKRVPKLGKSWWPPFLEGNLDTKKIHEAGFQLYVVEEPATASKNALELFAVNWTTGRGFFYEPPA